MYLVTLTFASLFQNQHVVPMNSNVKLVDVFLKRSDAIQKMTVVISAMKQVVLMLLVVAPNSIAAMVVAYRLHGNVILKMTVVMVPMKVIPVLKRHVPIISLLAQEPVIAFLKTGSVTVMTIASTNKTNKTVLP